MGSTKTEMTVRPALRRWLRRGVIVLVVTELAWLAVINTALFLPVTQDWLNQIRPEKFQVRWERAWSWYPGQVTAIKPFANGQSRSQQWQASVDRVNARIALLPLIAKRVYIPWGEAINADYRQRPRLRPDRDYTNLLAHYPDIDGYAVVPVSERPLSDRRPWTTVLGDVRVIGEHTLWIHQFRAAFDAVLGGGLSVVARGGPLEMDIGTIDIDRARAWVNTDQPMLDRGRIEGSFGFAPFNPRATRGLPVLRFMIADLELDLETRRLDFIDVFLLNFDDVHLGGSGAVTGRLVYDQGDVGSGTALHVNASDLRVDALALQTTGAGDIDLRVDGDATAPLVMDFSFRDLEVQHRDDDAPLLEGDSLALRLSGSRTLDTAGDRADFDRTIEVTIDTLSVPDLALYQRYVPKTLPFILQAGDGRLGGRALLGPNTVSIDLELRSERADVSVAQYRFATHLDGRLRLENPDVRNRATGVGGTRLQLAESRLQRDAGTISAPWEATIDISDGELTLLPAADKQGYGDSFEMLRSLGQKEARAWLADSSGQLSFDAAVSSLAFLEVLLAGGEPSKIRGDGRVQGLLVLSEGLPDVGTQLGIESADLGVTVLDYAARGHGRVDLSVEEGGEQPDWRLALRLDDGEMRRDGDELPGIEAVQLRLDAVVEDASFEPGDRDFDLRFQVPSATVPDMAVFNSYLPPDAPLALSGGTADLVLDLRLSENDADGFVRLAGETIDIALEGQDFQADLLADLLVVGGSPREMVFDLAGSTLGVDKVRVSGVEEAFDSEAWSASLVLDRADATWRQPPVLDLEARLLMSDSRPFVALMRNNGGPAWLGRMLTVEDIQGAARLTARDNRMRIPSAEVASEDITVGMKALIAEAEREGMILLRWKALHSLLKVRDGRKNVDMINARKTFEGYEPPR